MGNPYPSALDITDFIDDNDAVIDGTLYFWEHTGEDYSTSSGNEGHYQANYQGGYSQRNRTMGVAAINVANSNNGTFDWENAIDNGNAVSETKTIALGGTNYNFKATVTIDDSFGIDLVDKMGAGGTTGNVIVKNSGLSNKSFKVEFDEIVDLISIYLYNDILSTTSQNAITIIANDSNRNAPVTQTLIGNNGQTFNLDWTNITSFTITSQNSNNIVLDNMVFAKGVEISLGNGIYHAPSRYMAVGQGFFISTKPGGSGGQIIFKNSQREFKNDDFSSGGTFFFKDKERNKEVDNDVTPILKLGMNFKHNNIDFHRQIGISFISGNTFNYENGYDSEMYDVGTTDMFWQFDEMSDKKLIIAGVGVISNNLEVPLSLVINSRQIINISIDELEHISEDIFLLDKATGKYYDLKSKVELNLEKGNYSDRFILTFKKKTLSLEEESSQPEYALNIYVDNLSKEIIIQNSNRLLLEEIQFYTIIGQKIYESKTPIDSFETKIKISERPSSFYILNVKTNRGFYRKKLFIK